MGDSGGAGRALLEELWETPTVRLEASDSSASTADAKPRRVSRRSEQRAAAHASRFVELEVEADEERREQERRRIMLAAAFGHSNSSRESASAMRRRCSYPFAPEQTDGSRSSSSDGFDAATGNSPAANTAPVPLVVREKGFRLVRRGSDPLVNDEFYATQVQVGNFVKMGWLTKQGHSWKTWKTRFFVLFSDGTFAYYKSKGRKRIKGCIQLNDGVVSVQHVDVRRADKPYVFQVEKGFYRLICYCCSQFEAELWVSALRAVRRSPPPCPEIDLTAQEEKAGSNAVSRHMNKIFIADQHIADKVALFKSNEIDHSFASIQNFIVELDDIIIDRYHLEFYQDEAIEMLPGNDLVRLIRRNVEDRIFLPLYAQAYSSLETYRLRVARGRTYKNRKVFQTKPQEYFGVPAQLAQMYEWTDVVMIVNTLDCVSLPTHKLEVIVVAGKLIADTIAQRNGKFFDLADETLTAIFRYVLSRSSLEDLPILRALLKSCYVYHPACLNNTNVVEAFLDAIKWIEGFESEGEVSDRLNPWTLAASRVSVTISTNDVGIQLTNDGNGRGAIVYSIRKQSQAALSAAIVPGLALIAINHEPVVLMSFHDVVRKLRTAPLPKTLTFLTEFYYYQLLSLDAEMFQYLTCAAASRGDKETLTWLRGWCHVDLNQLCSWEKSRGKQIFGFEPTSAKGTALHAAAHSGQSVMVKHLLGLGADPNQCDRKLKRPLHVVKQSVDIALIIQLLVDSGADIDAQQQKGLTPLMGMCARGSLEGAATLLALGADIHRIAWSTGFSALEFAVVGGFVDIVELCLSKGADPNSPTLDGNTSVHLAAAAANPEILLTLLQNGGDPNTRNRFGQSPIGVLLSLASQLDRGRVSLCLDVLVTAGCRLETRDIYGRHAGHQVMILGDAGLKDQVLEDTHNTSIDIFGCTAEDYGEPALNESSIMELTAANALDFWRVDESSTKASSNPRTVDDLVESLVGIGTLNIADVLAFVLSLDTLSSLDDVLDCIGNRVNHRQNGYGMIRLYVLVQLFKPALAGKLQNLDDRFHSLASQVLATDSDALAAMVDEYKSLYHRCFQLSGTKRVLKSYAAIPSIMEKRYSTNDSCNFDPTHQFSHRFHQFVQAENWAEHVTLITHALFCSIPVQEFALTGSKHEHSPQFVSAKRWFQHLSAYVVNAVLSQETPQDRAEVVTFFLAAAEHLSVLHNYDSLAAILYALQSTAVQRLRRTIECMSVEAKKLMNRMQVLSDKGCREMNRLMRKAPSPCMPYIGLCLQNFVGLNELPVFDSVGAVNTNRLHRMGVLLVEIFHRQTVPYALRYDESVDNLLHVSLPFDSEESRYQRSLELEPREAGAAPLSDRGSYVTVEDLDIESEVRESIGGEGTFGLRQWFRKQKLVHRNRSRSSVVANYEWV